MPPQAPQRNFFTLSIQSFKEAPFLVSGIFFLLAVLVYMIISIAISDVKEPTKNDRYTSSVATVPPAVILPFPTSTASTNDLIFDLLPTSTMPTSSPFALDYDAFSTSSVEIMDQLKAEANEKLYTYIEVTDSCGVHFQGECVRVRSGPGLEYPVIGNVRTGVVLKTDGTRTFADGHMWYHVIFDEWLSYPERLTHEWYVAGDFVREFLDPGTKELKKGDPVITHKRIVVDISDQLLFAYEGENLVMVESVSTGLSSSPTPIGNFTIFKKTPSRYMQGPLPGNTDYYDLPGVPWDLYFTHDGAVIHGAFWHESFGALYSHGCVNLPVGVAEKIYKWAELGTPVKVQE